MLKLRGTVARAVGLFAALATAALACFALLAASASAISITITLATCAGGGTDFCFSPEAATAQTGALITWNDHSGVAHQIAPCTPAVCPGSPSSTGHDTFNVFVPANGHGSFTFTSAGTYYYYCTIHGYAAMHGSITVTASATPPPTPRPTVRPTPSPTHRPSMRSATPKPASSHPASRPPIATQRATPSPTGVGTPNVAPVAGSTPPSPTPSPQAVAAVTSGTGPALPIAIVVAILLAASAAGYLAFRRSRRQAG